MGIFFTICAPIAWYLGSRALKEIKASGTTYNNQQQIVIGRTLGIIFTILAIIGLVLAVFFVILPSLPHRKVRAEPQLSAGAGSAT